MNHSTIPGYLSESHLVLIIDALDGELCLRAEVVVGHLVGELELGAQVGVVAGHDLVEDVVATLAGSLSDDTRLLEQVVLNVTTGEFTLLREVGTDELSETRRVVVTHGLGVT